MSLPTVMITSKKATQQSMTHPSLSVPNAPRRSSTQAARAARRHRHRRQLRLLLNETGSTFKCSLDGAPFYGQRQASAGVRDYLQLERGDGCFSATGWEQGSSGPPFVSRNLLRRSTCRDHPGRGEGSSRRSAYRLPPWLLNSVP